MDKKIKGILWWACLFAAPLVLAGMELFHPSGFTNSPGMYAYLCTSQPFDPRYWALGYFGPNWWFTMHMVQLPMLGLVSVGLWMAVEGIEEGLACLVAWLSRVATFIFLICYTALDSIGGIGLGRSMLNIEAMRAAGTLTPEQAQGAIALLNADWVDPLVGGVGSLISLTGSWMVLIAAVSIALALHLTRRAPWPALVLLIAFGWEIQTAHASPHGPIGFLLLAVAGAWIRLAGWPALARGNLAAA
ncbi:MAG: hypothetical protein B7Y12_22680 [Rhizobiales bacterium 24-66-13]|jgi:hypothetical protein|nr:MAG: hypothetical protein B7Y61_11995 [Rhizobiales bacterium 35-66-30]OYZ66628.1 MAG: hypothetical protein B7Y12_22680 [Rhizobiales bacterium 24-66-13]OZA95584.1 MAG: hypothetical protein B7X67_25350 [Rhizobiales bacterium 39-66-18]HQS10008.1 hypothetical protein [Xanthobacteraceae bacterium]